ncbi:hypothetical protein SAMN02787073_3658 [Chryseobacterium vrystaatense]|uniref:Uncharacterized protein n=1 Tax=Chryseobacterium vrystaatense TaxID=307480 RepID=A0A1M5HCJ2_9FLAO|nr:hypothetical protein SAMN02787073_3658 [Chryseobacterium vrystaatense]
MTRYNGVYNPLRPSGFQKNTKFIIIYFCLVWAGSSALAGLPCFLQLRLFKLLCKTKIEDSMEVEGTKGCMVTLL